MILTVIHMQNVIVPVLKKVIQDVVEPAIEHIVLNNYVETVFFPSHYINHWTLMTLYYNSLQWSHYDSNFFNLTRSTKASNPSFNQSSIVVSKFCIKHLTDTM